MRYGSVCSGIEAASCAWESLGWQAAWLSEIAPWPSKFLAQRFPLVPNHGSLVGLAGRLAGDARRIDVLVGGTPCQAFSVSGLRGGLTDDRGNLTLEFARLAAALRPRWLVWENVPGVLSDSTNAFGCLLGALSELGYGLAWRVLDAQFFGVAQRRERVFLVGHLGAAAAAGAVLFEPEGVRRNPPTRGEAGEDVAGTLGIGAGGRRRDLDGHGAYVEVGTGNGSHTQDYAPALTRVRRLTPRECERLQGFPDDWTAIDGAKDTPRYAALGNSMAVPCMVWLGRRIELVDGILRGVA